MDAPLSFHIATITSKLQLTLPKRLCTRLGLRRGDRVAVSVEDGKIVVTPSRTLIAAAAGSMQIAGRSEEHISIKHPRQFR